MGLLYIIQDFPFIIIYSPVYHFEANSIWWTFINHIILLNQSINILNYSME
jgi:hypothetical protein